MGPADPSHSFSLWSHATVETDGTFEEIHLSRNVKGRPYFKI